MIEFFKDSACQLEISQFLGLHTANDPFVRNQYIKPVGYMMVYRNSVDWLKVTDLEFSEDEVLENELGVNEVGYVFSDGSGLMFDGQSIDITSEDDMDRMLRQKVYLRFSSADYQEVNLSVEINGDTTSHTTENCFIALDFNGSEGTYYPASTGIDLGLVPENTIVAVWVKYIAPVGSNFGRYYSFSLCAKGKMKF